MTVLRWDRADPYRCMCGGIYQPILTRGKLVKTRDPAWSMKEDVRDTNCLQRHCRKLAQAYRCGIQHHRYSKSAAPGYPDCHLWCALRPDGGGGSAYIELKRMGENPTDAQVRVMAELQDATPGGPVYLARPCCLLTGVIDEMLAELSGRPCLDIRDGRAFTAVEVPAAAPVPRPARSTQPARPPAPPPRRAPLYRLPPLPGTDPQPFAPATGYVIANPQWSTIAWSAIIHVERWLRAAGFAPTDVPFPMRLIVGDGRLHVQCRVGLARQGNNERVWREGTPAEPLPQHLLAALDAEQVDGESSDAVAARIADVTPAPTRTRPTIEIN